MGAAQSKKRRKEQKKRRRLLSNFGIDLDMPRSASVDAIRTFNVSTSSCPNWETSVRHRTLSASFDRESCHHTSLGLIGRETAQRTFCSSFGGFPRDSHHRCACDHAHDQSDFSDGYESCPSFIPPRPVLTSTSAPNVDTISDSTMCLNQHLFTGSSHGVPGRSRADHLGACRRVGEPVFSDEQCHSVDGRGIHQQIRPQFKVLRTSGDQNINPGHLGRHSLNNSTRSSSSPLREVQRTVKCDKHSDIPLDKVHCAKTAHSLPLNVLDDESSIMARWRKQKMMAQQLRLIRRQIQVHESSSDVKLPLSCCNISATTSTNAQREPCREVQAVSEVPVVATDVTTTENKAKTPRKPPRKKFAKLSNYRNLDSHPVMSKLQNEQNNRLECMEKRMNEIKMNAMREAERRKFAEIFPAQDGDDCTEREIQEAREALEKLKEEKKTKCDSEQQSKWRRNLSLPKRNSHSRVPQKEADRPTVDDDSGDIIPVRFLLRKGSKPKSSASNQLEERKAKEVCDKLHERGSKKKADWIDTWPNIDLGQPLTWIWLPFLIFPLVLRLILSFVIKTPENKSTRSSSRNNSINGSLLDSGRPKPK